MLTLREPEGPCSCRVCNMAEARLNAEFESVVNTSYAQGMEHVSYYEKHYLNYWPHDVPDRWEQDD